MNWDALSFLQAALESEGYQAAQDWDSGTLTVRHRGWPAGAVMVLSLSSTVAAGNLDTGLKAGWFREAEDAVQAVAAVKEFDAMLLPQAAPLPRRAA